MSFAADLRKAHAAGVRTAWADPEHTRLTEPPPEERVNPKLSERLRKADPTDLWALPAGDGGER